MIVIINIGVRLLAIIALSGLLYLSVSATETDYYYRQPKKILPKILRKNLGITCEKYRSYSFDYLTRAGKRAFAFKHPQSAFPIRFGVFKYEMKGPYYLHPIYSGEEYYQEGIIGEDFVVIDSRGYVLGGVTVRLIYDQLQYYPCLPQRTNMRLINDETILSALEAAVDNPGSSGGEIKTVGVKDKPEEELVVTQDETDSQGWNPFMPMKYWELDGRQFFQ